MTALRQSDPSPRIMMATSSPRVSPTPLPRAIPRPPDKGEAPSTAEVHRLEVVRQEAAERQARVWFNAAVQARREGRLSDAMALAAEAYQAGPSTYLADEALLIQAQCADNLNYRTAADAYVRLASEKPDSAYAPLALLQAARVARRQGRPEDAARYLKQLRERYPRSRQAAQQKQ
jgi:TolA-binding protein